MPETPEPNDLHNLDDLTSRLYRRDLAGKHPKRFDSLHPHKTVAAHEWQAPAEKPNIVSKVRPSYFKRFFFVSLGIALLAILVAAFIFFTGGNTVSNNNIDIKVLGNSFTAGGDQLPLQLEVVNKNSSQLELADLFVEYDKGADQSGGATHVRDQYSVGTIASGKSYTKNIFLTLYGQEGQVESVDVTLQYHIGGSNAVFVKKQTFPVTISSTPIALSLDGPTTLSPNQDVTLTVHVKSNAKDVVSGLLVHVDYPTGFTLKTTSEDATAFNNVWNIGDLAPGAEHIITLTGTLFGQDGEDRNFHVYVGAASDKDPTSIGIMYNSLLQTVALVKPFLAANLSINGSEDMTVPVASGGSVQGSIDWANSIASDITDAEITVQFSGNAIDTSSIKASDGFYDSKTNSIIWNSTTTSALKHISSTDTGSLGFSFATLSTASGSTPLSKPSVKMSVSVKGKMSADGGAVASVTNFQEKTAVVSSQFDFAADALYTNGPFSNTGPVPPVADQPTTYTITWTVTNSSNALSGGVASATIPVYMDYVGTKSPSSEDIQFDTTTRTIRWRFGAVPGGAGYGNAAKTVSFQLRLNPSTSQIGSTPKLILDTTASALDMYTNETLTATQPALTTFLTNDSGFPANGGVVTH